MTYTLTRAVTVALIIMCLLITSATVGGGRRETFPADPVGSWAQADGVLLLDSFDRADSPQLGAPWLEAGEVLAEFVTAAGYRVGPAYAEVSQGALAFGYANHSQKPQFPFSSVNGRPVVYAPLARGVSARPAVFSFTFEPHTDNRVAHEAGLMSAAGGFREVGDESGVINYTPADGLGISFGRSSLNFDNSWVSIVKYEGGVRTVLAERVLGFQFAYGKTCAISLTVAPDFSATVHVSDGVNTEQFTSPATTVSFPLDQFFIADIEGGVSSDTRGPGVFALRFDDVLVREISPAPTCFSLTTNVSPVGGGTISNNVQPNCQSGLLSSRPQEGSSSREPLTSAGDLNAELTRNAQADETFRKLLEKADGGRSIRVIVGLNVSAQPEGVLRAPLQVRSQRADIARVQGRVLRELSSSRVASVKKFPYIPFIALETDAVGLARLKSSPSVRGISEDLPVPPSTSESVALIGAPAAWSAGYSGAGQTIAILDTGVDKSHPFLAGKVVSEACYSTNSAISSSLCPGEVEASTAPGSGVNCPPSVASCGHGTHVAGIAAGKSNGGGSGVAKDANLIAIQVFSRLDNQYDCGDPQKVRAPCIKAYDSDYIRGLQRVQALSDDYDIAAVNLSLGTGRHEQHCDSINETTACVKAAIDNLKSLGIATVISAGNEGYGDGLNMPACISSAVSVGSTDDGSSYCPPTLGCFPTQADAVSVFGDCGGSNVARHLDLFAPGRWIYSSIPSGFDPNVSGPSFENKQGTSMAAPHVAGAWAVLKSRFPSATVDQILDALTLTGVPIRLDALGIDVPRIRVDAATNALAAGRYNSGTVVTLTAAPAAGYVFQSWSGCGSTSGDTCTATMSLDKTITANFAPAPPTPTPTPTPTPSADLSIMKAASVNPAEVGRIFTYTINVSNAGPYAANDVTVTDALTAGVTFTAATPSQGSCAFASGTVTCQLGSLAAGGSASVALQVKPRQTGSLMNTASVTAAEADPDESDNSATSNLDVIKTADLKVSKSDSPDPVFVGQQLTYTMLVTNLGPLNSTTGVTLTDSLPPGMTFVSAATTQGSLVTPPVGSTGIVTADIGSLAVGAQATVTVTVTAAQPGAISNTATVSSNETDTNAANNTATQTTTVREAALQKVLLASQVLTGGCQNTTGQIYLTGPAGPGGLTAPLSSSVAGASVPASAFIAAGQTVSSAFTVTTSPVAAKQAGLITAGSGAGAVSRGITINVGSGSCQ